MGRRFEFVGGCAARLALAACVAGGAASAWAQLPFFPGAEGYGGTWSGTAPANGWLSNATVYRVTNLNDSGPGSLRGAFVQNSSNKIIVFDVAGTINLTSTLDIKNLSNYYIAGQTAPGLVTVLGATTQINASNNRTNSNIVLRYLSFRGSNSGNETLGFKNGNLSAPGTNMIIDHVSGSWSQDEVLSVANANTNITVQYSAIHDALRSDHAYASLIRPQVSAQVSFHHNLYANNASRQARFGSYLQQTLTADFRNNVIYNWSDRASYSGGSTLSDPREYADVNYVGNYLIAGPATTPQAGLGYVKAQKAFIVDKNIDTRVYQSGNEIDSDRAVNPDGVPNGSDTGWDMFFVQTGGDKNGTLAQMSAPFATAPVTTQSADDAYRQVIEHVGNWWWNRDAIDSRVINNLLTNTAPPVAANAPIASELNGLLNAPMLSHPAGYDFDNDGMADAWEAKHGGNLVWNADFDNDGYINLIEFINELGEFPAPAPIVFNGGLNNRYAHIMNWKTDDGGITAGSNWQPSKYDEAQINSGTVVVDAVGQHAGVLKIAATAGSNAQLQVNSGWLEVADSIVVGANPAGQGALVLNGGQLAAQEVVVGFLGQVRGSGTLTGNITNGGAVLPGASPGTLTVVGNYAQTMDGVLSIDLASPTSFDQLVVNGDIQYGGLLEVNLLSGYEPLDGASFNIIDWTGTKSGSFDMLALPTLRADLEWDVSQLDSQGLLSVIAAAPVGLAGDYNNDQVVDAADYSVWRDKLGSNAPLANETASLGIVDGADYDAWKSNFGAMAVGSGSGMIGSVPEPVSLALVGIGLMCTALWRRR